MILVFDTETTGFPKTKYALPFHKSFFENARMIEIAYLLIDENTKIIHKEASFLINKSYNRPPITNHHIHGITDELVEAEGVNIKSVFEELYNDLIKVHTIVAHNMDFDIKILLSEIYRNYSENRHLLGQLYSKKWDCTIKLGLDYMKVTKFPKLLELYKHIFNEEWEQSHRALDDARVCAKCYIEMIS